MARKSLFHILSRSPWWLSVLIAGALFAGVRMFLPDMAAAAAALPFLVIAGIAAYRQLKAPGAGRVAALRAELETMSWEDFRARLEAALQRQGYQVERAAHPAADLVVLKAGRRTAVLARRWKAAKTGVQPLEALVAAIDAHDARGGFVCTVGEFSPQARDFAAARRIELVEGEALARLLLG